MAQMNKLLLSFLALGAGVLAFLLWRQSATETRFATAAIDQQWHSRANQLAESQAATASLRDEVRARQRRLQQLSRHPAISPQMLLLLEGNSARGRAAAWAALRQQLGLGWDSSRDYVLVSKEVIKGLQYSRLLGDDALSSTAVDLLALSPDEQSAIKAALQRAREGQWLFFNRTQPSGDIVAQYTVSPPDPAFEQAQCDNFSTDITASIGADRASLFLPQAWQQFISDLAPSAPETMTIRQTVVDGQPDLIWEVTQGANVTTDPVRYAHLPNFPLLKLFPGGWQALAQSEGFDLPPIFSAQNSSTP
jgi:hypothetical protein